MQHLSLSRSNIPQTLFVVKKLLPLTVYVNTAIIGLTACEEKQAQDQHATSYAESSVPLSSPVFEVKTTDVQQKKADHILAELILAIHKPDAVFEIVVSTSAHLALPIGKQDPASVTEQRWLSQLREFYGYHRLKRDEAMKALDELLNAHSATNTGADNISLRVVALLSQIALVERE